MAVKLIDTSVNYLHRTTSLLPHAGDSTVCFWMQITVVPANGTSYILMDDPVTYTDFVALYSGTTNFDFNTPTGDRTHTAPANATWYHIAWTQTGTSQRFYINGAVVGAALTYNRAAVTVNNEYLGQDGTGSAGETYLYAYCREWTVALTSAQIIDEMQATTAVHTANLYMDCPFNGNVLDISGNGHDWTTVGSATFVDPPSFPTNHTAATATALTTTLPSTLTVDFADGIVAWYSYTPTTASPNMLGFWAFTTITEHLETAAYTGSPSSLTLFTSGNEIPMQLPLDVGTTYYLRLLCTDNVPPSVDVAISTLPGPTTSWAVGDVMINDDGDPYRASIFDPLGSSYAIKTFGVIPPGEQGDVLSDSGILLFADVKVGQFALLNADLSSITNIIPSTVGTLTVRSHQPTQTFYVGMGGSGGTHASLRTLDDTGAYGGTTWTLAAAGLAFHATNNDETILYYASSTGANTAIKRWDLTNNIALADFKAGVAGYKVFDIFVLSDDTVLVTRNNASTFDATVTQYDAAGTVLHTYTCVNHGSDFRICTTLNDTSTFVRFYHDNVAAAIIDTVTISTGAVAHSVTQAQYQASVLQTTPVPTATPPARFGNSNSCPIVMLRTAVTPIPPGEPVDYIIRRERWWPHISSEQFRQFFSMLQVDLFAGNGITTGQGSDPLLEVDWSDDGGHTWSSIHFVRTGKIGAYRQRAILRRMGYSRDRVYRIAVSDPNQWVVINGYLQAVLGTS